MPRSADALLKLFAQKTVVDLAAMREALDGASVMTVFRYLGKIPYRRSYDRNGAFYCLHEPSRYDRVGLWSFGGIHFSKDGSLKATVRRLVHEAAAGATHRELSDWLRVRVHNTLLSLVRGQEVSREQVEAVYVYLHPDRAIGEEQLARRREQIDSGRLEVLAGGQMAVDDAVVIQVLLTLIRHPGSRLADVVRRLRGHAPPITSQQVQAVFTRYELGEKGGPSKR